MQNDSLDLFSLEMLEKSAMNLERLISLLEGFLARLSASPEQGEALRIQGELSSLISQGLPISTNLGIWSWRTLKGYSITMGGNTVRVILDKLRGLDYHVQLLLLNTKDFDVPQNRERVFFICSAPGERRPEVFRIRERKTEIVGCNEMTLGQSQGYRVYNPTANSVCLASQAGGVGAKTGLYAIPCLSPNRVEKRQNGRRFKEDGDPIFTLTAQDRHGVLVKSATKSGYEIAHEGGSINFSVPNSKTRRGRVGKQVAQTLDTACNQAVIYNDLSRNNKKNHSGIAPTLRAESHGNLPAVIENFNIRRLTPIECERLQDFPDDWTKYGENDELISDSQRYKTIGNSVTVRVVEAIMQSIKDVL